MCKSLVDLKHLNCQQQLEFENVQCRPEQYISCPSYIQSYFSTLIICACMFVCDFVCLVQFLGHEVVIFAAE